MFSSLIFYSSNLSSNQITAIPSTGIFTSYTKLATLFVCRFIAISPYKRRFLSYNYITTIQNGMLSGLLALTHLLD